MKMIFLGDAARDSGSVGFSEACPLCIRESEHIPMSWWCLPAGPNGMDIHSFGNINDEFDVGVIVVVRTSRHLYSSISP